MTAANRHSTERNQRLSLLPLYTATALLLAGCGRDEVKVYQAPKEPPPPTAAPAPAANPHAGMNMGGGAADPHAGMGMGANPHGGQATETMQATVPEGWETQPADGMRAARYLINGKNAQKAEVSVIPISGMNASKAEIVNLWRQQVKLAPLGDTEIAQLIEVTQVGSEKAELYDMVSTEGLLEDQQKARILVAMQTRGGATWFFKVLGHEALVKDAKPAFINFLKSVTFKATAPAMDMSKGMGMGMPPGMAAPSGGDKPKWQLPADWKEVAPTQMLLARFEVTSGAAKAIATVSQLPGDGGGNLGNINRWRGQLGKPPLAPGDLPAETTTLAVKDGGQAVVTDFTGTDQRNGGKSARMIAVILPQGSQTWFYKFMGDTEAVAAQKEAFLKFVQTITY